MDIWILTFQPLKGCQIIGLVDVIKVTVVKQHMKETIWKIRLSVENIGLMSIEHKTEVVLIKLGKDNSTKIRFNKQPIYTLNIWLLNT